MHIDETRSDHQPGRIQKFRAFGSLLASFQQTDNAPVFNQQISEFGEVVRSGAVKFE